MFSKTNLLETAKASPLAVAAHDKSAWLNLFSEDAEVHDPVGSKAHAGRAALERFYDTFIAPNKIHFNVEHDLVCGQTVVRDLVIETRMGGTPLQVNVPLFIRYELVDQNGDLRVRRLYAHWELLPMMSSQVFNHGLAAGMMALLKLSINMLNHQGLTGALGFSKAFSGVGASAKKTVTQFLEMLASGDDLRASTLLATPISIRLGAQDMSLSKLTRALKGLTWQKMLAGGRQVSARLSFAGQHGVALFDFPESQTQIGQIRIYTETA